MQPRRRPHRPPATAWHIAVISPLHRPPPIAAPIAPQALIAALAPTFRLSAAAAASLAGQGAVVGTIAMLGHVEVRVKSGLDLL